MNARTILIVDDESIAIMISEKLIKLYNPELNVMGITSPIDAISYLETHRPDVIFLDIRMPLMDGFDFLDAMKEKGIPVPVILLTSSTSLEDQDKSKTYGNVLRYLIKPLTVEKIELLLAA